MAHHVGLNRGSSTWGGSAISSNRADKPADPLLWVDGRLGLRVIDPEGCPGPITRIVRPFAVIGRAPTADLVVEAAEASLRHVYLHLDHRGVFAVDLASRTGTRFDGASPKSRSAWLTVGSGFELVGHRIELVEAEVEGGPPLRNREAEPVDLMGERAAETLEPLVLEPLAGTSQRLAVTSELAFLGRSRRCALTIEDDRLARVHALIVRRPSGSFLVDLVGEGVAINGQSAPRACPLVEGDRIALGGAALAVRFRKPKGSASFPPPARIEPPAAPARASVAPTPAVPSEIQEPLSVEIERVAPTVPPEQRAALVSWVFGMLQASQQEMLRRQDVFQRELIEIVRENSQQQTALLREHLEKTARLRSELEDLRDELRNRQAKTQAAPGVSRGAPKPKPKPKRRRSPKPAEEPPPVRLPEPTASGSRGSAAERPTTWLIDRIQDLEHQVEEETQSFWKGVLGRLGTPNSPQG